MLVVCFLKYDLLSEGKEFVNRVLGKYLNLRGINLPASYGIMGFETPAAWTVILRFNGLTVCSCNIQLTGLHVRHDA